MVMEGYTKIKEYTCFVVENNKEIIGTIMGVIKHCG